MRLPETKGIFLAWVGVGFLIGLVVRGPYELRTEGSTVLRVNRLTGTTWVFGRGGWIRLEAAEDISASLPPAVYQEQMVPLTIQEMLDLRKAGYDPDRAMRIVGNPDTNINSPIIELKSAPLPNGQHLVNRFRISQ